MARLIDLTDDQKKELLFTPEEILELEKAKKMPVEFDEDCPAVTPEKALRFKRVNPPVTAISA